ncbi:MAG TPA: ATP-binding protein [Clostridiales bacterium]|nr:ATP-binding protein [Clostridiales bacterium]
MGYSREVYEEAMAELDQRRMLARQKAAELRDRMVAKYPRILELEREMANAAIKVARAVLAGEDVDRAVEKIKNQNLMQQAELAEILAKEGIYTPNFEPRYHCPACQDTGVVNNKTCDCLKILLREIAYKRLSYPGMAKDMDFEKLRLDYYPNEPDSRTGIIPRRHMKEIIEYCKNYAEDFDCNSPSLLLRGATGTGKTHVSLSIAKVAIDKGFGVIYGPVQKLLHKIEKEHFGRADGNSEDMMIECDLLILDDLGTEFSSPFYTSCLYNLINSRILDGKPTIISTNFNQNELMERYGEQITSRIIGNFVPLTFVGKDIRQIRLRDKIHNNGE